ncbi:MAG: DMT family transporter [Tannerellaceae bacterium]|jgi:drug/metabolite transporter (DMT)-like permease|nr:DMT family transporter [Tannerellaceae bacterium]
MWGTFFKLHISILLAGFTGILGKLITLNEGLLVWYRLLIAAITLFFIPSAKRIGMRAAMGMMGTGALLALHWIFFFGSIKASNVSIGVATFSMTSFFTALLEPLLNRKRISVRELMISMIAVMGIFFVFHFDTRYRTGIMLGGASALLAALFSIANKWIAKENEVRTIVFYEMTGGFWGISLLLPVYLFYFPSPTIIPDLWDWIYLLIFGLVCTVGLYLLQIEALKSISAFTLNLSYNLEPVYSITLAMLLLGEARDLNVSFYVGLFLIVCSVGLQTGMTVKLRSKDGAII